MNSRLVLTYEFSRDGDDFGWLMAEVETPCFAGRNGMWVQWQDLDEFAASLSSFPVKADSPLIAEWGFGEQGQYTEITRVSIAPRATLGGLVTDVSLANYYEPANRCRARFDTDYPAVAKFREEIQRMIRDRSGSAVLEGSADFR